MRRVLWRWLRPARMVRTGEGKWFPTYAWSMLKSCKRHGFPCSAVDAGSSGTLFMEGSHAQAGLHQLVEQLSNRELPV